MRYHDDSDEAELCVKAICNQKPNFSCGNLCVFVDMILPAMLSAFNMNF